MCRRSFSFIQMGMYVLTNMDMNVRNISNAMMVPMTEAIPSRSRRMHRTRFALLRIVFLKAALTMLVPQNRIVKGAGREYINVIGILSNLN
jgi:hypothetical protein